VTKSRARGTAAETGVTRFLNANGFPHAERRRLRGARDWGDLVVDPRIIVEVKGGDAAKAASLADIGAWMIETEIERQNADADYGLLVVQRRGVAPTRAGAWRAFLPSWAWASLLGAPVVRCAAGWAHVEVTLAHAVEQIRWAGIGEPLTAADSTAEELLSDDDDDAKEGAA
jgi:hypothetical protein